MMSLGFPGATKGPACLSPGWPRHLGAGACRALGDEPPPLVHRSAWQCLACPRICDKHSRSIGTIRVYRRPRLYTPSGGSIEKCAWQPLPTSKFLSALLSRVACPDSQRYDFCLRTTVLGLNRALRVYSIHCRVIYLP